MAFISTYSPIIGTLAGLGLGMYAQHEEGTPVTEGFTGSIPSAKALQTILGGFFAYNVFQEAKADLTPVPFSERLCTALTNQCNLKNFLYMGVLAKGAIEHRMYAESLGFESEEFHSSVPAMLGIALLPLISHLFTRMDGHSKTQAKLGSLGYAAAACSFLYHTAKNGYTVEETSAGILWAGGLSAVAELAASNLAPTSWPTFMQPGLKFALDGDEYKVKFTRGDGACALHALLGQEINGEYRFPGDKKKARERVKTYYLNALEQRFQDLPGVTEAFTNWLNNSKQPKYLQDRQVAKVFPEGNQFTPAWRALQVHHDGLIEEARKRYIQAWHGVLGERKILDPIMSRVAGALEGSRYFGLTEHRILANPQEVIGMIDNEKDLFKALLNQHELAPINEAEQIWRNALNAKENAQNQFILNQNNGVFARYKEAILNDVSYNLDTTEIGLAAQLFDKHVKIVSPNQKEAIELVDRHNEGDRELVVIHQAKNHFSRCVRTGS